MELPDRVKIVEVSPRDGLQNEPNPIAADAKVALIDQLSQAGLSAIEVSSFVSPARVPQLADAEEVFAKIRRREGVRYSALVPNEKGLARALGCAIDQVAVFTAASETFCQRNIQCSIAESLARFETVVATARQHELPVRAYISCVAGCPYEGVVEPRRVADLTLALFDMGVMEVSLGDTIGAGTPGSIQRMLDAVLTVADAQQLAVHFHDTRGQALANILIALAAGISVIDSSVAGLGGCPYAKGATGNVATEDVVYMLHGMGIQTGIDLAALIEVGRSVSSVLGRDNASRVGRAGLPGRSQ